MSALTSKLSSKAQTVFPREIRDHLGVGPGDRVRYRITREGVVIEKIQPGVEEDPFAAFTEWSSPEDDEAFADL
jgi:antitoxin PrlF